MAVRRSSTVAAEARAAARQRRADLQERQRERDEKISKLAEEHAVAVALADEVLDRLAGDVERLRVRADEESAGHRRSADATVVELLGLGERAERVAELLGLTPAEVRAARRRVRSASGGVSTVAGTAAAAEVPADDLAAADASSGGAGEAEDVSAAA